MEKLGQAQQEAQAEMEEKKLQMEQMKLENENMNKEKDRQVEIEKALISAEGSDKSEIEMEKIISNKAIKDREIQVKEKELEIRKQDVFIKDKGQKEDVRSNRADESIDVMKIKSEERKASADRNSNNTGE